MNNSINQVAKQLNIKTEQVSIVLDLIKDGATVPFIARYRKSITNGLDEEQIEQINTMYVYDIELTKRKAAIINFLKESGVLTDELESRINNSLKKAELESIYEPFKLGKKTKASEAIRMGLEPFAKEIFASKDSSFNVEQRAKDFLTDEVKDVEFAIEQTKLILAQYISQDLDDRNFIKSFISFGSIKTKVKRGGEAKDTNGRFRNYYDSNEKIAKMPNHRIMAVNRAEALKVINVSLVYNEEVLTEKLAVKYSKNYSTKEIKVSALKDSLKRLILPSIEREIRKDMFEKANKASIDLFAENLEQMLLAPAVQDKVILAIDPAFISGSKIAVLSKNGSVKHIDLINPNPPRRDIVGSTDTVNKLIDKFKVDIIVIGNGTASRETEAFIAKLTKNREDQIPFAIVSEVGASVYSASKTAIKEFPDLSVEQRSAITIGRRFQDPLNELVKIDPKAIGVGQYQHDVNQKELSKSLEFKTLKVVNNVGVDVNTATAEILSYVAGLTSKTAQNIIDYREEVGNFKNRKELKKVKGLGSKSYEQAIGFIRIYTSDDLFDRTTIHPESYKLARNIIKYLKIDLNEIDVIALKNANPKFIAEKFESNEYDVQLIIDSLIAPGKDIRADKEGLILKTDVLDFKDIKVDMELEGTVQNITDFGAFIYIGIKEAALIHISNLSDKFVSHPSDIVKTGQRVSLKIIDIDRERKRIQGKLIDKT